MFNLKTQNRQHHHFLSKALSQGTEHCMQNAERHQKKKKKSELLLISEEKNFFLKKKKNFHKQREPKLLKQLILKQVS